MYSGTTLNHRKRSIWEFDNLQNTWAIVQTWAQGGQVTVAQAHLFKALKNQVWLSNKTSFISIPAHYIEPTVSYSVRWH